MIPAANHPMWARLIRGEVEHKFSNATAGLLVFNLRHEYKNAPGSLCRLIDRARQYFNKCENVLAEDIKQLFA